MIPQSVVINMTQSIELMPVSPYRVFEILNDMSFFYKAKDGIS